MIEILSFIVVLGVLIFIHELGHLLAARHVGVRVEAFSIGFPPTAWGKQVGETEYRLSWIPLGGYVKLFGQNFNDENTSDPTNYAAKSILQRLYILLAGPAMNLLFALIFMPLVFWVGKEIPAFSDEPPIIQKVQQRSYAQELGVLPNDEILAVNGNNVKNWEELHRTLGQIPPADDLVLEIDRRGNSVIVNGSAVKMHNAKSMGWLPFLAPIVGGFSGKSPARKAGIKTGDKVVRINGKSIQDWYEISPVIQKIMKDDENTAEGSTLTLTLELDRKGEVQFVEVVPYFVTKSQRWLLGMSGPTISSPHSFGDSIILGSTQLWFLTQGTFSFLGQMIQGKGSIDDLGGPVKIAKIIGNAVRSLSIDKILQLISFISLQLCIFNLLPIPALDGGHIFMLLIEKIKGGPLSKALRERTQMIGFSILISLMIFVTWNDIISRQ